MKKLAQKKRTDSTSSVIVCFYEHLCDLGEKKNMDLKGARAGFTSVMLVLP